MKYWAKIWYRLMMIVWGFMQVPHFSSFKNITPNKLDMLLNFTIIS